MYNTTTQTYTVVDIRKTFENFQAELGMIARRTKKWEQSYVEDVSYDVIKLAENKYLKSVDIVLMNSKTDKPVRATRYTVSLDGKTMKGDRAGGNNWSNIPDTYLHVIVKYSDSWGRLSEEQQQEFRNNNSFKINWSPTSVDTTYSHLEKEQAQLFGSKGYELQKENFS